MTDDDALGMLCRYQCNGLDALAAHAVEVRASQYRGPVQKASSVPARGWVNIPKHKATLRGTVIR